MKRPRSSDSIQGTVGGGLIPQICLSDDKGVFRRVGSLHSILDGFGEEDEDEMMLMMGDESGGSGGGLSFSSVEKKRRLSVEQVKALEKNFEVENKLEPERKVKLAQDLGLQPRQVAVWFQNRRARWKTKQLERDYGVLKASYDALKLSYGGLVQEKEALLTEIKELKAKLVDGESSYCSIEMDPEVKDEEELELTNNDNSTKKTGTGKDINGEEEDDDIPPLLYKDGSSESDSSQILNELSSPSGFLSHRHGFQEDDLLFIGGFNSTSSSSSSPFHHYPDGRTTRLNCYYYPSPQQQMVLKLEESEEFLSGEDPCSTSFFSDDQPPELAWWQ